MVGISWEKYGMSIHTYPPYNLMAVSCEGFTSQAMAGIWLSYFQTLLKWSLESPQETQGQGLQEVVGIHQSCVVSSLRSAALGNGVHANGGYSDT